jgi:hypothetical protein
VTTFAANSKAGAVAAGHAVGSAIRVANIEENRRPAVVALPRIFHLASLDAPTVAAVWTLAFAWSEKIRLPLWTPIALWLVAWSLYIADRTLDARAAMGSGDAVRLRDRHRFHWRRRRVLIPLAVASGVAAAVLVFVFMPAISLERNTILAAATLAYFTGVHSGSAPSARKVLRSPRVPKELLVGLLFTAGCALPAWTRLPVHSLAWPYLVSVGFFALLAWLNCHSIDGWESEGGPGRAIVFPAGLLAGMGLISAMLLFSTWPRLAALLVAGAASAVLLVLLDRYRSRLSPLGLRAAADLVLLTPLVLLWR